MKITFKKRWVNRIKLGPGAKPWFLEPQRWWNRPKGVYLQGNRAMSTMPDDKADKLSSYIRSHMPHAFLVQPHDAQFMGLAEWLDENTTSVYARGHYSSFTQYAVFLHHDDDAFAFRMRWFAKYVKTKGDPELDEIEQMYEHMQFMTETIRGMLKDRPSFGTIFRING
jgi:hypothetical protein